MQSLVDLGIDDATARSLGLKVYKVAMPWPLEPQGIQAFSAGCRELLVCGGGVAYSLAEETLAALAGATEHIRLIATGTKTNHVP